MKASLPILTPLVVCSLAAVAVGQALPQRAPLDAASPQAQLPVAALPAAAASPPPAEANGDAMVGRVLATVDGQRSIAAKLRHKIDLLGTPQFGTGLYLQQGRGPQRLIRFELKLQGDGRTPSVEEVSNGSYLWIYEQLGDDRSLARVDLGRLARGRPRTPGSTAPNFSLSLGGLPRLLLALQTSFHFAPPVESRLDDLRVWTLDGQWNAARLSTLLPEQKAAIDAGQGVDLSKLAPQLPDRVVLRVGYDDLFPYRIEFWRANAKTKDAQSADRGKLLVVMELYEVQIGGALDPRQFVHSAADLQPVDRTQAYLDRYGLDEVIQPGASQPRPPRR